MKDDLKRIQIDLDEETLAIIKARAKDSHMTPKGFMEYSLKVGAGTLPWPPATPVYLPELAYRLQKVTEYPLNQEELWPLEDLKRLRMDTDPAVTEGLRDARLAQLAQNQVPAKHKLLPGWTEEEIEKAVQGIGSSVEKMAEHVFNAEPTTGSTTGGGIFEAYPPKAQQMGETPRGISQSNKQSQTEPEKQQKSATKSESQLNKIPSKVISKEEKVAQLKETMINAMQPKPEIPTTVAAGAPNRDAAAYKIKVSRAIFTDGKHFRLNKFGKTTFHATQAEAEEVRDRP